MIVSYYLSCFELRRSLKHVGLFTNRQWLRGPSFPGAPLTSIAFWGLNLDHVCSSWLLCHVFLAHPARRARWAYAMAWRPSSVRPSTVFKMLLRYFSTDFDSDCFHMIGLGGGLKLLHRIVKFIIYANLCKFIRNYKKCFFSFISRPIWIWFALSGRANFGTLNFYTEFWNCSPLINYGNLCKFFPKITKIASSPSFLDRFWFWLPYLVELNLEH